MDDRPGLIALVRAIAADYDLMWIRRLLDADPTLATGVLAIGATREDAEDHFLVELGHYVYAGDTALHLAAASHRPEVTRELLDRGSDVAAANRRRARPLHYAADGRPGSDRWRPDGQAQTIRVLLAAGADPNAADLGGTTPLHRAVRTRCSAAVRVLLDGGADPRQANRAGSAPFDLASRSTGRSGSGGAAAKDELSKIRRLLGPT